jgi:hypothetical protein
LGYFMTIWYIFPVCYHVPRKIWQPWPSDWAKTPIGGFFSLDKFWGYFFHG